ncbi:glycerol ether metabolic process [Coemansia spiralis]|uniref:Glycerol ether metabolic process n=1 Tax=Coemansia spiralis TaxID=417178 RepID=A0A9W8L2L7_9FUNG|nr:glycerol ether metabolic process [Coemansia spiralis]
MKAAHIQNQKEFDELLKTKAKVAVDFTATWCGPCKVIGPKFDALVTEHPDVTFVKVDVDEVSTVATTQKITAMPTFKFFVNGKPFAETPELIGANLKALKDIVASLDKVKLVKEGEAAPAEKPKEDKAAPVEKPKEELAAPAAAPAAAAAAPAKKAEDVAVPEVDKAPVVTDKAPSAAPAA